MRPDKPDKPDKGEGPVSSEVEAEGGAFRAYFFALEEHFGRQRGRPLLLSPRDVALARQWWEAGIDLEAVLRGLERFFIREAKRATPRRGAPSLAYVERDVVLAHEERKAARLGSPDPAGAEGDRIEAVRRVLRASAARLERARRLASERGETALAGLLDGARVILTERAAGLEEASLGELEQELARIDRRIASVLISGLDEARREELTARARAELEGYASRLSKGIYARLLKQAEQRLLLEERGLFRLALLCA